jgi:DNA-binding MarR family transcriptional regulator
MTSPERDSEHRVLIALRRITKAISLQSLYLQRTFGLTGTQLLLLRETARREEVSGGELAKALSLSHASVTTILDRLENRGLIVRTRSTTDRRRFIVDLTVEGHKILNNAPPPLQSQFIGEFRRLEEWEQTLILSSLQRVATMMHAEQLEAAPVLMEGEGTPTERESIEFLETVRASEEM